MQPRIRHCDHSHFSQKLWQSHYPYPCSRSPRNHCNSTPNVSYRKESDTKPVAIATTGSIFTSITVIRQSQHPSIWSLRHDVSCCCNGRLLELYMWNWLLFLSACDLETVSYVTRRIWKASAQAPHWQILETYWNTTKQQNNIWFTAFEVRKKEILKEACWSNSPCWILHA